jgi:hypothetical protein
MIRLTAERWKVKEWKDLESSEGHSNVKGEKVNVLLTFP